MLVLVVGPSGAGKDTLIAAAKAQLAGDAHFAFPRRLVTRHAVAALEDHDTISWGEFHAGQFPLSWEAHGLGYALPPSLDVDLAAGRTVVVNVSRRVIPQAAAKYPGTLVLMIAAAPEVRARRLASRGRETEADIATRLAREVEPALDGVRVVTIDNSGELETAVAAFVAGLSR